MSNINKYRPLDFLSNIQKEINREINQVFNKNWWFDDMFSSQTANSWIPHVDIKENSSKFIINVDLPGVELKDIEIFADHNVITIKGERNLEHSDKGQGYSKIERLSGNFYRKVSLPDYINTEQVQAAIKDGVLSIIANKKEDSAVKKIKIQPAENLTLED